MEALHQAWVEDPRSGLHIGGPGGLGPSPFLMDRHARCLEQLTLPPPPLRPSSPSAPSPWAREEEEVEDVLASALPERPHTSCGVVGLEGDPYDLSPPQRDNMSRVQRYIDCHRPDSASSARSVMRKELEGTYRRSLGTRGKSPHFCNFVHKVDLHARYDTGHARTSTGSDDEERNDSMLSDPTDQDILAQWRKHSRLTGSGTEGRPGSPSSVDGRHAQDRNTSNTNTNVIDASEEDVRSVSVIVNHFVNSEGESVIRPESMVTQDDQQNDEDAVVHESEVSGKDPAGPSRKDIATMTTTKTSTKPRVIKTFISPPPPVPRVRMIPTITIPSSPLPSAEQPLSNRTSEETSPRKSAREDSDLRSSSVERSRQRPSSASRPPPKEAKDKADKAKRAPVAKKTKKSSERRRKSKSASMEHAPTEGSASAEAPAAGDASSQPTTNGLDVDVKVPDLPGVSTSGKDRHGKKSRKGERRLISPPVVGEKPQLPPELLEDSYPRNGYDFSDMESAVTENYNNKFRLQSWMNSRIALSQQASRFELPMDMKLLEQISTQDYLRRFCVVTSRRVNLYQKIFIKHKDKSNTLNKQGLETCLKETLVQALKENTYTDICDLLDITDETVVDFKLFSGVAAIIERILYPFYTTEDTIEMPEFQRERIETADFQALDWKLHGIKVSPKMRKLLKMLQ